MVEKKYLLDYWKKNRIITDRKVLKAFEEVPRELFVLEEYKSEAYEDVPLPIHKGQTISQPTTVVIMLQELELKPGHKVLEIGAGSGYNAALMAKIVGEKGFIYTLEVVPELVKFARQNLKKAGINNVKVIHSDGSKGYSKEAPYDRIIVTAAAPKIPNVLVNQLKEGGALLIPVGPLYLQHMIKGRKIKGKLETEDLGDYAFVPLKGKYGY